MPTATTCDDLVEKIENNFDGYAAFFKVGTSSPNEEMFCVQVKDEWDFFIGSTCFYTLKNSNNLA